MSHQKHQGCHPLQRPRPHDRLVSWVLVGIFLLNFTCIAIVVRSLIVKEQAPAKSFGVTLETPQPPACESSTSAMFAFMPNNQLHFCVADNDGTYAWRVVSSKDATWRLITQ